MPSDLDDLKRHPALRQADQARTDFAVIETELAAIHARFARRGRNCGVLLLSGCWTV